MAEIPKAVWGSIGGSGTWAIRFPEDLDPGRVRLVEHYREGFETPYGRSAPFKLIEIAGAPVLRVAFHGLQPGNPAPVWTCATQVAWVFQQAGVKYAIVDGSVGGIQSPDEPGGSLPPWSVVITNDFIQHWPAPITRLLNDHDPFPRMRGHFCPSLRHHLDAAARQEPRFRVFGRGTYICTPFGRFETPAEIEMARRWGAHVVGQTLGHEAPLMKQLGIHLASLNIVSNYAEGNERWVGDDSPGAMETFYWECSRHVAPVIVDAFARAITQGLAPCACTTYYNTGLRQFPVDGA